MRKLATMFVVSLCIFSTSSYLMIPKEKDTQKTQPIISHPYDMVNIAFENSYQMTLPDNYRGTVISPSLSLNKLNQTFSFSYDFLSSYLAYGKYEIKDNVLIATTDDNQHTYQFKIKDDKTLLFQQEGSSYFSYTDPSAVAKITNGAEFAVN